MHMNDIGPILYPVVDVLDTLGETLSAVRRLQILIDNTQPINRDAALKASILCAQYVNDLRNIREDFEDVLSALSTRK